MAFHIEKIALDCATVLNIEYPERPARNGRQAGQIQTELGAEVLTQRSPAVGPMTGARHWYERAGGFIDSLGLILAGASCVAIVVMVMTAIISRAAGRPALFADEYSGFLMAALVFLGLAMVTREHRHIQVEFIILMLGARTQAAMRLVADCALFAYAAVLCFICGRLLLGSYFGGLRSQGLMTTPLYIPQAVMMLGLLMLAVRAGLQTVTSAREVHRLAHWTKDDSR